MANDEQLETLIKFLLLPKESQEKIIADATKIAKLVLNELQRIVKEVEPMKRDDLKKKLSSYSKDEIIEALLISNVATGFVLEKCKALYGVKDAPAKKTKKETVTQCDEQ